NATGFRLPPGIHNGTFFFTYYIVIPHPGFRVYGLSYSAQYA
ncbi:unnamed protein product, partial [marine sediment metagenome]